MTSEEMMRFLDQEMADEEREQMEQHLTQCSHCQRSLKQYAADLQTFDQVVMRVHVPESFTDEVMAALLSKLPEQGPHPEQRTSLPMRAHQKTKGKEWMKKITFTAAGFVLAVSLGAFVSPTFAAYVKHVPEYVKQIFFGTSDKVDEGVRQAAANGYASTVDQSVTDQGITLNITEVFADPSRVYVKYTLNKNGDDFEAKDIKGAKGFDDVCTIQDTSGQLISGLRGWSPVDGVFEFNLKGNEPKQLNIHVDIREIDSTKGKWEVTIPVDLEKGQLAVKTTEINQQFTSPEGINLSLQHVQFLPSVTRLQMETSLTADRIKQLEEAMAKRGKPLPVAKLLGYSIASYGLHYHILDGQGQVVAAYDDEFDREFNDEKNRLPEQDMQEEEGKLGGKISQAHAFTPLKEQNLRFQLLGIYSQEPVFFSRSFDPDTLSRQPITENINGSSFTIKSFRLKTDTNQEQIGNAVVSDKVENINGRSFSSIYVSMTDTNQEQTGDAILSDKVAILEVEGKFAKDRVDIPRFEVADASGNKLSYDATTKRVKNPDGTISFHSWIFIRDLEKQPKELTLSFDSITKVNRDVKWEVPIQLKQ
ncbi:DUF4179 domain-containing protein [Brevibacillus sp. B_LB10_24]|uniref:DUF4179 domain-containing protein n=1 Tax=Brevibacillus sp. B_LB10_24 TaxID=3380645 RepID=UPI0038B95EBB